MLFLSTLAALSLLLVASAGLAASAVFPANYPGRAIQPQSVDRRDVVSAKAQDLEDRAFILFTAKVALMGVAFARNTAAASALAINSPFIRGNFTRELIKLVREENPNLNWVVVYKTIKHTTHFEGDRGLDWDSEKLELPAAIRGPSLDYTLYAFKAGEFTLVSDASLQDWAYTGNITTIDRDGKHFVFADPMPDIGL